MGCKVTYKTIVDGVESMISELEVLAVVKNQAAVELLYQSIIFHTKQVNMK